MEKMSGADFIQILVAIVLGIPSLILSAIALYFSFFKGAEISIFQKKEDVDVRIAGRRYGIYDQIWLNVPFYVENIGNAKATVLSFHLGSEIGFDQKNYRMNSLLVTDTVSQAIQNPYPTPFIFPDGEVKLFNAQISLIVKNGDIQKERAREFGKYSQEDLRSFPKLVKGSISCFYKDGRGKEKTYKSPIGFNIGNKLEELAGEIEKMQSGFNL